eukprot:TRINITY_DN32809_c0_g1_i1.p1 TRINITY_DN32809_c0_g1~~TRINITY_DN32809_c0_g1_i1.p1  ORF type:complete len:199 (+),score=38.22 TRINITY_DN32809_c0_g1_i1:232-828(+)
MALRMLPRRCLHRGLSSSSSPSAALRALSLTGQRDFAAAAKASSPTEADAPQTGTSTTKKGPKPAEVTFDDFAKRLKERMGLEKTSVAKGYLNATLGLLAEALAASETVRFQGFGKFESKERTYNVPSGFVKSADSESAPSEAVTVTKKRPQFTAGVTFVKYLNYPEGNPFLPPLPLPLTSPASPKEEVPKKTRKKVL